MKAILVQGLAFGDEGKGSCTDALVRRFNAKWTVRFNGGPQAAHNVVTPEGLHHTFAQFGSGTFAGANTYLSQYMLIDPIAFMNEEQALSSKVPVLPGVYVERSTPIITPFHWMLNRTRERLRGDKRHGSCGFGVGELRRDMTVGDTPVLLAGNLYSRARTREILESIKLWKVSQQAQLDVREAESMRQYPIERLVNIYCCQFAKSVVLVQDGTIRHCEGPMVFEGAQGVLLDETQGFAPYNTWTDCTFGNAEKLLEGTGADITRIGVLRAHWTRHGPGPFPTESELVNFPDHNSFGVWQGEFRQGYFDGVAARHAVSIVGKLDGIALTCLDRVHGDTLPYAAAYDGFSGFTQSAGCLKDVVPKYKVEKYSDVITEFVGVPLVIESFGPMAGDKHITLPLPTAPSPIPA